MNRSEAWHDLGGNTSDPSMDSLVAMYNAGLIPDRDPRRKKVEAFLDIEQRKVNARGAATARAAGIRPGTDTNSVEFLVKQRLAERNRNRKS